MDYKNMTDEELANIMINQIGRVSHLLNLIRIYIEQKENCSIPVEKIKEEYKKIKSEFKEDYNYLNLSKNKKGSYIYTSIFTPSIKEAYAEGFSVPSNSKVDFKMFSTIETALYKLNKYYSLEEWENVK
mgnify:CR=1 FL=1